MTEPMNGCEACGVASPQHVGLDDRHAFERLLDYSAERAEAPIRRRLAEAGCVSAAADAWTLARALRNWAPGRYAEGLVMSVSGVDSATAREVVVCWGVGIDEHVRTLLHLAQRYGVHSAEGRKVATEARALTQHAAALRADDA